MKYIDDESYKSAVEKQIRRLDRQDRIEAERPIKKAKKNEYVKRYQKETNYIAKYTARRQKRREANREEYNAYMREFQRRKRAKIRTQKEAEQAQKDDQGQTHDTDTAN